MTDPWRYLCPDCGSHTVYKLNDPIRHRERNKPGVSLRMNPPDKYRCEGCDTRIPEVYDKKIGNNRKPDTPSIRRYYG